jgi:hypothetical protein
MGLIATARRRLGPHWPVAVYALLALAVAGGLLLPGLVLAVDIGAAPHPHLPSTYFGLPEATQGGVLARLPLDATLVVLGDLGLAGLSEKLLLLASVFLAGLGMHRLVPVESPVARTFAGLLFAINPFVYDRLYAGQWFVTLGYALLPWAFASFLTLLRRDAPLRPWRVAVVATLIAGASPQMLGLLVALCAAALVAHVVSRREVAVPMERVVVAACAFVVVSLWWLLPTPALTEFLRNVDRAQLELYRTVPDGRFGLWGAVAGLHGFWNDPEPLKQYLQVWPPLALALVLLAVYGLVLRRRDALSWAVALAGAFGFLLALGTGSVVTRGAFVFALEHVEALRAFREPQKAVALVAFAYAYLGAAAVDDLVREPARRRVASVAAAASLLLLPTVYGYRCLGGLWGSLHTSEYPVSWERTNAYLLEHGASSRTLFLPWYSYLELSFAHGRLVANPAPRFFETPLLASRAVAEADDAGDRVERRVRALLAAPPANFGACLARLGVEHVVLAKEQGWEGYRFLDRRPDVATVRRFGDLTLYRLRRPGGLVMDGVGDGRCDPVRPVAAEVLSPPRVRLDERPARLVVGLQDADRWVLRGDELRFEPWQSYLRNYAAGAISIALGAAYAASRRRRPRG